MKILQCDKEHIFVNRETGGAGSSIYMPDTMDEYRWCKVSVEDYNKWIAKDNKQAIHDSIKEQLLTASTIDIQSEDNNTSYQLIDPTKVDIVLPNTVYTFADLMSTVNTTLFNNVDLNDVESIYQEIKQELNIQ